MEVHAWRYHPEFRINVLVNGESAGDTVTIIPSPAASAVFRNYGVLTRAVPGGLVAYVKQHRAGVVWQPAVALTQATAFPFWLSIQQQVDFFASGTRRFGRQILYANNLNASGAIDSSVVGNTVRLSAAADAGDAERGALSTFILSTNVNAGAFTALRAGKIAAGAPVGFSINEPITAQQTVTGIDISLHPKGSYIVRLEGGAPVQERVIFDQQAAGSNTNGIIEIYKDAWLMAPQPREYSINLLST